MFKNYEYFIGFRYLKAKRKQSFISVITIISMSGIAVGVMALIVVLSVMTGFEDEIKKRILGLNSHVLLYEFGSEFENSELIMQTVKENEHVLGASPFIQKEAMLTYEASGQGVVIRAIDVDTVSDVAEIFDKITQGSEEGLRVTFGEETLPGILLGLELSRNLGVTIGDRVNIISPGSSTRMVSGIPRMAAFEVSGIFEAGMYEYDSGMAFMSIANAQRFFKLGQTVTGIEIKVDDIYKAREIGTEIRNSLEGTYYVRIWEDMNRNLFSALKMEKIVMFVILTLIILVAALNIISTLIMVVMEKGKDIAILKSMGATKKSIMKIFMTEGLVIGVAGTFIGLVLGLALAFNIEHVVGFIENILGIKALDPSVYYISKVPSKVEASFVIIITLVSLTISFLATLYPSYRASKYDPVEGLRYE